MNKIVLVGPRHVGKTSLIRHLNREPISRGYSHTEGREIYRINLGYVVYNIIDGNYTIEDIDTADFVIAIGVDKVDFVTEAKIIYLPKYPIYLPLLGLKGSPM